jgi:hypothetical protein
VLVADANVLIRAILGARVRTLLARYGSVVEFFAPYTAWAEAREHLPAILTKRGVPIEPALSLLNALEEIVQPVEFETYGSFEQVARMRLATRDLPRTRLGTIVTQRWPPGAGIASKWR